MRRAILVALLTPDAILEAAETVLRQHGPQKTTVVDVARALKVSHAAVYRHFPSKAALREAVVERWLHRLSEPLRVIAGQQGAPGLRLKHWFQTLSALKRSKAQQDPQLFAMYQLLATEADAAVQRHLGELIEQVIGIVRAGIDSGEFQSLDPRRTARSLMYATVRFHDPAFSAEWVEPGIEEDFEAVWELLHGGPNGRV